MLRDLTLNGMVQIRPEGYSMTGKINSGQLVTLVNIDPQELKVGDIALVKWKKQFILHLIVDMNNDQFLMGNNLGKINGWVEKGAAIAKVVQVED